MNIFKRLFSGVTTEAALDITQPRPEIWCLHKNWTIRGADTINTVRCLDCNATFNKPMHEIVVELHQRLLVLEGQQGKQG